MEWAVPVREGFADSQSFEEYYTDSSDGSVEFNPFTRKGSRRSELCKPVCARQNSIRMSSVQAELMTGTFKVQDSPILDKYFMDSSEESAQLNAFTYEQGRSELYEPNCARKYSLTKSLSQPSARKNAFNVYTKRCTAICQDVPFLHHATSSGLLQWCRDQLGNYAGVTIKDMTTSWRDGLAFCALISHFRPDLVNFEELDGNDVAGNIQLAFDAGVQLGLPRVIEVSDLCYGTEIDEKLTASYVLQLYLCLTSTKNIYSPELQSTDYRDDFASCTSAAQCVLRDSCDTVSSDRVAAILSDHQCDPRGTRPSFSRETSESWYTVDSLRSCERDDEWEFESALSDFQCPEADTYLRSPTASTFDVLTSLQRPSHKCLDSSVRLIYNSLLKRRNSEAYEKLLHEETKKSWLMYNKIAGFRISDCQERSYSSQHSSNCGNGSPYPALLQFVKYKLDKIDLRCRTMDNEIQRAKRDGDKRAVKNFVPEWFNLTVRRHKYTSHLTRFELLIEDEILESKHKRRERLLRRYLENEECSHIEELLIQLVAITDARDRVHAKLPIFDHLTTSPTVSAKPKSPMFGSCFQTKTKSNRFKFGVVL